MQSNGAGTNRNRGQQSSKEGKDRAINDLHVQLRMSVTSNNLSTNIHHNEGKGRIEMGLLR